MPAANVDLERRVQQRTEELEQRYRPGRGAEVGEGATFYFTLAK